MFVKQPEGPMIPWRKYNNISLWFVYSYPCPVGKQTGMGQSSIVPTGWKARLSKVIYDLGKKRETSWSSRGENQQRCTQWWSETFGRCNFRNFRTLNTISKTGRDNWELPHWHLYAGRNMLGSVLLQGHMQSGQPTNFVNLDHSLGALET